MKNLDLQIQNFLIYLGNKGCSPYTQRNYRSCLTNFARWLKGKKITLEVIDYYRFYLVSTGMQKQTQKNYFIALRSFFTFLKRQGHEIIDKDLIDFPKVPEQEINFLTSSQVEDMLEKVVMVKKNKRKRFIRARDRAILELLFSTGLRVSELCNLDRKNVDLKTGEFTIIGKGGRSRLIFLSQRATYWLKRYLKLCKNRYTPLFVYRTNGKFRGRRMQTQAIENIVHKYALKAKIPMRVTAHLLRHAFACDLLRNGANLRLIQELLGHKSIATTQIYTHITNLELKEGYRKYHSGNFV